MYINRSVAKMKGRDVNSTKFNKGMNIWYVNTTCYIVTMVTKKKDNYYFNYRLISLSMAITCHAS